MMSNPISPAIAAASNALQQYVNAGRVALGVTQGGQVLEILILDPTLTIPAPAGLQLLHFSTGPGNPMVCADPAAGLSAF
jgi:hypothetical protein